MCVCVAYNNSSEANIRRPFLLSWPPSAPERIIWLFHRVGRLLSACCTALSPKCPSSFSWLSFSFFYFCFLLGVFFVSLFCGAGENHRTPKIAQHRLKSPILKYKIPVFVSSVKPSPTTLSPTYPQRL